MWRVMTSRLDTEAIARARAVSVTDVIHRRSIKLRRAGLELVGACPVCGDGGKGSRSNRFAVYLRKKRLALPPVPTGWRRR